MDTIEVGPHNARAVVIWMHGLGADGHDFESLVPVLGLPEVRFVFPNAAVRPVTLNNGHRMRAWYDIRHLEEGPERESVEDIEASAAELVALIRHEQSRGAERIVIAGFSQGGAMAYHVGLRFNEPLAGIMALSTYLVLEDRLDEASAANAATPLLVCHGTMDDVVPMERGQRAYERLREGRDAEWCTFPCGHGLHEEEVDVIASWLHERLSSGT